MSTMRERLRIARETRGLSRHKLSLAAGLAQALAGAIERGDITDPGGSTIAALARVLGVSTDWLLTGEGHGPTMPEVSP